MDPFKQSLLFKVYNHLDNLEVKLFESAADSGIKKQSKSSTCLCTQKIHYMKKILVWMHQIAILTI